MHKPLLRRRFAQAAALWAAWARAGVWLRWRLACLACVASVACVACQLGPGQALAANGPGLAPAERLVLDDSRPEVDAWPNLGLLADPGRALTLDGALARWRAFEPPTGPASSLGLHREAVWLRLPLQVATGDGRWVFDIDFPVLNQADVYLVSQGRVLQQHRLGAVQPFAQRPMPSRSHAVTLQLPVGQPREIYLRVLTQSALVLPITLSKPDRFLAREAGRHLAQGLMLGVALALLVYSLAHWISLRNGLFGLYALMVLGSTAFFLDCYGVGQQHLWSQRTGLVAMMSPLSVMLAQSAGALFVARALNTRLHSPRIHRALMGLSLASAVSFCLGLLGLLDYPAAQLAATLLGPLMPLLVIPAAWGRARAGDRAGLYMLIGWGAYMVGAVALAGMLRGLLPANVWTQNLFQWGSTVEMLVWLRVLGLHIEAVRRSAERTELEKQALVSLAHTDALTGLPNRRGLSLALDVALQHIRPDSALVVYLLDLDGFKPINDCHGHDVGDALLVQVGQRLRRQVRRDDVVARLGGDEFVIMTAGISGEAEALALGRKLLDAFLQPFEADGQLCRVGLTIGFALAPHDGRCAGDLLKRADAAKYAGKQAGRHCIHRGGASLGLAGV